MNSTLNVIAPVGLICPMEGGIPVGTITEQTAVAVPNTAYYRRMLAEGSLLAAGESVEPVASETKKGGK